MSWYEEPKIERSEAEGVALWRLLGDWTRDLPLDIKRAAADDLLREVPSALVIDLADVKFVDSWGEETICDALQGVHDAGGRAAWTRDRARPSEYEGVKRALERRRLSVGSFDDPAAAAAAIRSAT